MSWSEAELARRRTLMGTGAQGWLTSPIFFGWVGPASWWVVSGSSSPDMNMVLVHAADSELLATPMSQIAQRACPALLMLAGAGKTLSAQLPEGFTRVGSMPFMAIDLVSAERTRDARVRRAGPQDVDTVTAVLADAYGFDREVAALVSGPLLSEHVGPMSFWLLEVDQQAVSTVTICRVQDSISLWCMGTRSSHTRRGYGKALLATVLDSAHRDGAVVGLLGATPAGQPLYEATGWRTQETWDLYTVAASEQCTPEVESFG